MATTTRKRRSTKSTASKVKTTTQKNGNGRNRADEATQAERRSQVQQRVVEGGESAATVAKDLGITPGKAAFIAMQVRVENGEVAKIAGKTDEQLIKNTVAARAKADQYSSWGWLSARTGVSEPALKSKVAAAGHSVAGEKIASVRKANRPAVVKKTSPTAKKTATAKASKSTRTRTRRAAADPS
jgi:hypothetical protein